MTAFSWYSFVIRLKSFKALSMSDNEEHWEAFCESVASGRNGVIWKQGIDPGLLMEKPNE